MPKRIEKPAKVYQLACGHTKPLKNRGQYKEDIFCFACRTLVKIGGVVKNGSS